MLTISAPEVGRIGRTQSFGQKFVARRERRDRAGEFNHAVAGDTENREQAAQRRLRMAEAGLIGTRIADLLPGFFVEQKIEPRQHDGAARRGGNGGEQPRGRAIRAGRADCDDRGAAAPGLDPFNLRLDQKRLAPRGVDEIMPCENRRPLGDCDVEEIQRDPPIGIEFRQNQRIQFLPGDVLDNQFIDETGEFAGEMPSIGRRCADETGFGFDR